MPADDLVDEAVAAAEKIASYSQPIGVDLMCLTPGLSYNLFDSKVGEAMCEHSI